MLWQRRTCGRCHQTAQHCPGKGFAKTCDSEAGPKVKLSDHMKSHWDSIKFVPSSFQLDMVEDEQVNIADVEIKSNQNFTRPKKNIQSEIDDEKLKAVVVKNLPPLTQETDLRK